MRVLAETAGGFSRVGVSGFPIPGPASAADGGEARIGACLCQNSFLLPVEPDHFCETVPFKLTNLYHTPNMSS